MSLKLYTKTGDKGDTSLLGGKKVPKSDLKIDAYGNVDELNSFIGLLKDQKEITQEITQDLIQIQNNLFTVGSLLATEAGFTGFKLPEIEPSFTEHLEKKIDTYTEELPELKNFILPGGHQVVSLCHVCRTVCRRAERSIVAAAKIEEINSEIIIYINRLSDYFFILSRKLTAMLDVTETPWVPDKN